MATVTEVRHYGMPPRFGPTLFLALTMNSKDPSGKGPKETWVEHDSHCDIKIQPASRNPGPSMPVLAIGLHFTYNSHEAMCDSFYGWDHHAAFPAMIDLIPCLRAFTDCLDNTRQECDKVVEKWSDVTHRCAWTLNSYSMRSADAHAILHIHSMSIQHLSTGLTPHSAECRHKEKHLNHLHQAILTLLLTVWHNMIKWYKMWPFNSVHNMFITVHIGWLVCFCWVLRGIGCSSRSENLCAVTTGALQGQLVADVSKVQRGSVGFYIAVLRRADLYLL